MQVQQERFYQEWTNEQLMSKSSSCVGDGAKHVQRTAKSFCFKHIMQNKTASLTMPFLSSALYSALRYVWSSRDSIPLSALWKQQQSWLWKLKCQSFTIFAVTQSPNNINVFSSVRSEVWMSTTLSSVGRAVLWTMASQLNHGPFLSHVPVINKGLPITCGLQLWPKSRIQQS